MHMTAEAASLDPRKGKASPSAFLESIHEEDVMAHILDSVEDSEVGQLLQVRPDLFLSRMRVTSFSNGMINGRLPLIMTCLQCANSGPCMMREYKSLKTKQQLQNGIAGKFFFSRSRLNWFQAASDKTRQLKIRELSYRNVPYYNRTS
jgi:hypothetical protein